MTFIIILVIILVLAIGFYLFLRKKSGKVGTVGGGAVGQPDQFDPTTVIAGGPSSVGQPGPTTPPDLSTPSSTPNQPVPSPTPVPTPPTIPSAPLPGGIDQPPVQQPPAEQVNQPGSDNQNSAGPTA